MCVDQSTKGQNRTEELEKGKADMGCIASKLLVAAADRDGEEKNMVLCAIVRDRPDHVVSLTSTTYGALKLDDDDDVAIAKELPKKYRPAMFVPFQKREEIPEVINAWELMKGLDDESPVKKVVMQEYTPGRRQKKRDLEVKCVGKENREGLGSSTRLAKLSPKTKPLDSIENTIRVDSPAPAVRYKSTPMDLKIQMTMRDGSGLSSAPRRRRSLGRLFDPDLIAAFENELCQESEQIKLMVLGTPRHRKVASLLESFEKKCPPGGESAVVLYTTTLRGIRKTFEDCKAARSAIESYGIQVVERDISMDSGFREELRLLTEKKEARVPTLFVKGRWIGGADEVLKLEEEGKLELLLDGVPKALGWCCDGCGGTRFLMCMECNGSCKLLDDKQQKVVKCGECNENGLIHCPVCC